MTAAQWVAAIVPIAVALAGGGLAWRSLKRQQDAQAGHSTSQALGDYVDMVAKLQERVNQIWGERNEARKELERVELLRIEMEGTIHDLFVRIDVLEVEVIRLGGDPTKLNGRH
jgi:ABC-type phosphate transport system auxiliary subunit